VRKVNAHTDAKATCFLCVGQRNGSFGLVGEGVGTRMDVCVPAVETLGVGACVCGICEFTML
jgi:hypothetical protein